MWHEQAIMEWSSWVTSNNACKASEQLMVLANGDDKSDPDRVIMVSDFYQWFVNLVNSWFYFLMVMTRVIEWSWRVISNDTSMWTIEHND